MGGGTGGEAGMAYSSLSGWEGGGALSRRSSVMGCVLVLKRRNGTYTRGFR